MLETHLVIKYLIAHRVPNTDVINASFDDPILLQAELDGYADRVGDQWIGRGMIKLGEQRTLRRSDGAVELIVGE